MTKAEQNKAFENRIRKLVPEAIDTISELMRDPNTPAPTKAQLAALVLERSLGKPDATLHLTTEGGNLRDSENRLIALAQEIREVPEAVAESEADPAGGSDDEEEESWYGADEAQEA